MLRDYRAVPWFFGLLWSCLCWNFHFGFYGCRDWCAICCLEVAFSDSLPTIFQAHLHICKEFLELSSGFLGGFCLWIICSSISPVDCDALWFWSYWYLESSLDSIFRSGSFLSVRAVYPSRCFIYLGAGISCKRLAHLAPTAPWSFPFSPRSGLFLCCRPAPDHNSMSVVVFRRWDLLRLYLPPPRVLWLIVTLRYVPLMLSIAFSRPPLASLLTRNSIVIVRG